MLRLKINHRNQCQTDEGAEEVCYIHLQEQKDKRLGSRFRNNLDLVGKRENDRAQK